MTTKRRLESALRAGVAKEDAALERRLPDDAVSAERPSGRSRPVTQGKVVLDRSAGSRRTVRDGGTATKTKRSALAANPPTPAPAKAPPAPVKRVRKTFSLGRSDLERLDALKATMTASGLKCRRSTLVRAALAALAREDAAAIEALLETLPPLRGSKR